MNLFALRIADRPERWRALGFDVDGSSLAVGGVTIEFVPEGSGITGWAIEGLAEELDGLQNFKPSQLCEVPFQKGTCEVSFFHGTGPAGASEHANGAVGIDQVVVLTPDFDRTATALEQREIPLRRIRDGGGFRQGFRRLGPAILELVEARSEDVRKPARFWGLVVVVPELEQLKAQLGELLGTPTTAVQAGRQIATVKRGAGLTTRLAFMTPEPG